MRSTNLVAATCVHTYIHIYHMLHFSLFLSHYFAPVMGDSKYGLLWLEISYM